LGISGRLTQQVMQTLLAPRLITEVAGAEAAYCPARPLEAINAHQVLLAVRSVNKPVIFTREEPVRDEIYGEFARIEEAERVAAASVTMEDLVNRARAKLAAPDLDRPATALTLPEAVPVEMTLVPVHEEIVEEIKPASPEPAKPARKIFVPEDNHDFPL
jgi:DNA-binding IscR family transcriptional regulator